jgi:competence protein ComEA
MTSRANRWAALALLAAGTLLAAALWPRPGGGQAPDWQPVNAKLAAALDAAAGSGDPLPAKAKEAEPSDTASAASSADRIPQAPAAPATPSANQAAPSAAAAQASEPAAAEGSQRIDLNAADAGLLDTLPKIGPAKARAIVEYRSQHGPFRSVDDLLEVKGIGPKLLAEIRDRVTVGKPASGPQR